MNDIQKIKKRIVPVLKKNKVKKAGIFGSYATGKQKKGSDVDIIIQLPRGIGFGFVGIQFELEKALGKKVDLVTYKGLSPYLKKRILGEEVRIL
ncbi:MAG TPA: nucleotidyltransferase family protein [Candidatus Nanoarchaeia archaeon]|nr:nucleotidyltransferase family protein [Candidatus Nanoarchaeia archaeon]